MFLFYLFFHFLFLKTIMLKIEKNNYPRFLITPFLILFFFSLVYPFLFLILVSKNIVVSQDSFWFRFRPHPVCTHHFNSLEPYFEPLFLKKEAGLWIHGVCSWILFVHPAKLWMPALWRHCVNETAIHKTPSMNFTSSREVKFTAASNLLFICYWTTVDLPYCVRY